jgi:long-chain fatty acid transport protein
MKHQLAFLTALSTLGFCTFAQGSGFLIYEHGARATALGGTLAAHGGDLSVMVYNPAGLAWLKGTQFSLGTTLIIPRATFAGSNPFPGFGVTEEYKNNVFFPSNFYVSHQLSENLVVGMAVFNPFDLGVEWQDADEFSGRHIAYNTTFHSYYFNPTVAYKLSPDLSIAVGLQAVSAYVELNRYNATVIGGNSFDTAKIKLSGDNGLQFGFNAGMLFQITDKMNLGLAYRSKVDVDIEDGTIEFSQLSVNPVIDPLVAASLPRNQPARTNTAFPAVFSAGLSYQLTPKLNIAFDAVGVDWSSFECLLIECPETPALNQERAENWKDAWSYRLGAEYQLNEKLALRAGYIRDLSPQPNSSMSPLLPDANRNDISFGFGYKLNESLTLDLANMFVLFEDRNTGGQSHHNFNGEYRQSAYLLGLNLTYSF